jgi:L-lactate dehydrogenase complex protein LldG
VATLAEVPAAVARYLAQHGLGDEAVATDEAAALDWSASGLRVNGRAAVDADRVGITGCFCAIAETGTLLLLSGPASPASVSLLPETHIAFIYASRILGTMEAAFDRLRSEQGRLPRALNFISGPSRTGDIEQTIVLGAHGPCRVHLILVEQA